MLRNKLLMLAVIVLLSFAWLAIEVATWLMALMARGALSVARHNVYLFQIDMRLIDAKKYVIGNGVPLPTGRAIAKAVRKAIEVLL